MTVKRYADTPIFSAIAREFYADRPTVTYAHDVVTFMLTTGHVPSRDDVDNARDAILTEIAERLECGAISRRAALALMYATIGHDEDTLYFMVTDSQSVMRRMYFVLTAEDDMSFAEDETPGA